MISDLSDLGIESCRKFDVNDNDDNDNDDDDNDDDDNDDDKDCTDDVILDVERNLLDSFALNSFEGIQT